MLNEFKDFIKQGNIVQVAVGLILALYAQTIIDALLEGVIYPIIAAIFGKPSLGEIGFDLGESFINIGLVIDAFISFVVVAFILFLIVKAYRNFADDDDAGPSEVDLLTEIRDGLKR